MAALGKIKSTDKRVIDGLLALLKDQNDLVRVQAVDAWGGINSTDERVTVELLTMMKDQDWYVRKHAAAALGNLSQSDERVIGGLLFALKDHEEAVRGQAAHALVKLGQSDVRVVDSLAISLKDQYINKDALELITGALIRLDQNDERVIVALLEALKAQNSSARWFAATALGYIGQSGGEQVITALLFALKDKEWSVRIQAIEALNKLGKSERQVIAALLDATKDKNSSVRSQAAEALGDLRKSEQRVIVRLLEILKDDNPAVRYEAAQALINLGKIDEYVITTMVDALNEQFKGSGLVAKRVEVADSLVADSLSDSGKNEEHVISAVVTNLVALKNQDSSTRSQAAEALGTLGKSEQRVIVGLLGALKDKDSFVREQAATALGKLYQSQAPGNLLKLLSHNLSGYRTAAAQGLLRQASLSQKTLHEIDRLRTEDGPPWAHLGAWEAYELVHPRIESEKRVTKVLSKADSLFANGLWAKSHYQYESAFDSLITMMQQDSVKAAHAKFQQARCAAKLKRAVPALDDLKIAFAYNPTLRDSLHAEMSKPENDWKILEGNWYLREVLLRGSKAAPNIAPK